MEDKLEQILKEMRSLKSMMTNLVIMEQLESIKEKISSMAGIKPITPGEPTQDKKEIKELKKEAFEDLKHMADSEMHGEERFYILHRATEDFEYERFKTDHHYEPDTDTVWVPEYMTSQETQKDTNPVISCLIPESAIIDIPEPFGNTSSWKEAGGKNPNAYKYKITVKPGKYKVYQEITY